MIPKTNFLWLFEFHSAMGWPSGKNGLVWSSAEGETGKEITGFTPSPSYRGGTARASNNKNISSLEDYPETAGIRPKNLI